MDPMTIVSGWSGKASTNRKSILAPLGTPKVKHREAAKRQREVMEAAAAVVASSVDRMGKSTGSASPSGNTGHGRGAAGEEGGGGRIG